MPKRDLVKRAREFRQKKPQNSRLCQSSLLLTFPRKINLKSFAKKGGGVGRKGKEKQKMREEKIKAKSKNRSGLYH